MIKCAGGDDTTNFFYMKNRMCIRNTIMDSHGNTITRNDLELFIQNGMTFAFMAESQLKTKFMEIIK